MKTNRRKLNSKRSMTPDQMAFTCVLFTVLGSVVLGTVLSCFF